MLYFCRGIEDLALELADLVVNLLDALLERAVRFLVGAFPRLLLCLQILLDQLVGDGRGQVRLLGGEIDIDDQAAAVIGDPDVVLHGADGIVQDDIRRGGSGMGLRQDPCLDQGSGHETPEASHAARPLPGP